MDACYVVPLAGTWIETDGADRPQLKVLVVPLAGTWIETYPLSLPYVDAESFPSRERGLKLIL